MPLPHLSRLSSWGLYSRNSLPLCRGLSNLVLGVRKEDKNRWERRVPLSPTHVSDLTKSGIKVLVESSEKRVFPDVAYEKAGAQIVTDLSEADLIVGVKEVPIPKLLAEKAYLFFSHTHKGQPYNMPMLDAILQKKIRLMDYELLTNDEGARLVKFGTFAGYAGMIDTLHGFGQRLLGKGQNSPFINIGMSYTYPSLAEAKRAVSLVGEEIKKNGNPKKAGPLTFVFTGRGNVSEGAQEIFNQLPHKYITPEELRQMFQSQNYDPHVAYGVVVLDKDYIRRKDGKAFDRSYYYSHPQEHYSVFHEEIAPYANVIINGIYWESKYPRLLTNEQTKSILADPDHRLVAVGDISCDIEGSMEFTKKVTTIDQPFFLFDSKSQLHTNIEGEGLLVMAIDNLPTEMAAEASMYFGNALTTLIPKMLTKDEVSKLDPVISRAVITDNGKLTPKYQYIEEIRKKNGTWKVQENRQKRVLMLGAGMVAEPVVDHLTEKKDVHLTIGTMFEKDAKKLAKGRSNTSALAVDMNNGESLSDLVASHDLTISLVPAAFHPSIADKCILNKKHMVTASYISPAMREMHERAVNAGVTIMNEIGLDPGIDHLSAMKIIDEVKHSNGKILSFSSVCGGLPAPEASDNPLGYKFSWSPKGVLLAGLNASKALRNGKIVTTPAGKLFEHAEDIDINYPGFNLECLPNRDSTIYTPLYGLEEAQTVFRGTLRYKGFSELMASFSQLGLFDQAENPSFAPSAPSMTWRQVLNKSVGAGEQASKQDFEQHLVKKLGLERDQQKARRLLTGIERLNLFSSIKVEPKGRMLDSLCAHLEKELAFKGDERDLVILHHDFLVQTKQGQKENWTSTLISYGTPGGYSAMAKTVGLPTAFAARLILDGHFTRKGVLAPMTSDIYNPILASLEKAGVKMVEKTRVLEI